MEYNRTRANWEVMVYGLASLADGLIMIGSGGYVISGLRGKTSMWLARRDMRMTSRG